MSALIGERVHFLSTYMRRRKRRMKNVYQRNVENKESALKEKGSAFSKDKDAKEKEDEK